MTQRVFASEGFTPIGVLDTAAMTNLGFMAILGGSGTQMTAVMEVNVVGLAGASAPTPLVLAHDSTIGTSLTALGTAESDAFKHPAAAALAAPVLSYTQTSSVKPQRSATLKILTCGLNAFGGIFKETFYREEDYLWMLGNTASLGEISLSCYTGGTPGLCMAHLTYETK